MRTSPGLVVSLCSVLSLATGCLNDDLLGPPEPPPRCPIRQGEVVNLGSGEVLGTSGGGVVVQASQLVLVLGMSDGSRTRFEAPSTTSTVAAVALEGAVVFPIQSGAFQVLSLTDPAPPREVSLPVSRSLAQLTRGGDDVVYLITEAQENPVMPGGARALERYRLNATAPEPIFTFPPGRDDARIAVASLQVADGRALWIERAERGGASSVVLFDLASGQERELYTTATDSSRVVAAKLVGSSVFISLQGEAPALLQLAVDGGALQASYAQPTSGVPFYDVAASGDRLYALSAPASEPHTSCWQPELVQLVPPAAAGGQGTSFTVVSGAYGDLYLRDGLALFALSSGCCGAAVCEPYAGVGCALL